VRRLLLALPLLFCLACGDDPDELRGLFDLTHVDGQALPRPVTIDGIEYSVESGVVDLHNGDIMSWSMAINPTGGGSPSVVFLSDFFRRVRSDSLAFPGGQEAAAEFFGATTGEASGSTLRVTTVPLTGSSSSFADQVGGAHTWTFVKR
jgi:hypothetical protein